MKQPANKTKTVLQKVLGKDIKYLFKVLTTKAFIFANVFVELVVSTLCGVQSCCDADCRSKRSFYTKTFLWVLKAACNIMRDKARQIGWVILLANNNDRHICVSM